MEQFLSSIWATFSSVVQVLALSSVGYLLAKNKTLDRHSLKVISRLLTNIFLPAFIFVHTVKGFPLGASSRLWLFPLLGGIIFAFSVIIALGYSLVAKINNKRLFIALISFQNCGYMPLIMIHLLFPKDQAQVLYMWVFLFILGFNFLVWSVGVWLLAPSIKLSLKDVFSKAMNPPFLATIVSVVIAILAWGKLVPLGFMSFCEILARPVLPLSMLVMGGILGLNCMSCNINRKMLISVVVVKLLLLPIIALIVLKLLVIEKLLRWFIMVEVSVPSAVSLAVISEAYGGDTAFISQALFYTHLFSLITLPIFVSLVNFW